MARGISTSSRAARQRPTWSSPGWLRPASSPPRTARPGRPVRRARLSPSEIMRALAEHWDEVLPHLEPDEVAYIAAALRRLRDTEGAGADVAAADIALILATRLPHGHSLRDLLSAQARLTSPTTKPTRDPANWEQILGLFQDLPGLGSEDRGKAALAHDAGGGGNGEPLPRASGGTWEGPVPPDGDGVPDTIA